jgi:hypothetical protein
MVAVNIGASAPAIIGALAQPPREANPTDGHEGASKKTGKMEEDHELPISERAEKSALDGVTYTSEVPEAAAPTPSPTVRKFLSFKP